MKRNGLARPSWFKRKPRSRRMFGYSYLALALMIGSTSATNCGNEVIAGKWGDETISIKVGTSIAVVPNDSEVCVSYIGMESCCSQEVLDSIESAFDLAHTALEATKAEIKSMDPYKSFSLDAVELACDALLEPVKVKSCKSKVKKRLTKVRDLSYQFAVDSVTCADAMMAYSTGMACFACSSEWEDYVDMKNNTINIAAKTCEAIATGCSALMADRTEMTNAVFELVVDILDQFPFTFDAKVTIESVKFLLKDWCDAAAGTKGDCRKVVCEKWLNGLHAGIDGPIHIATSMAGVSLEMLPPTASRAITALVQHHDSLVTAVTNLHAKRSSVKKGSRVTDNHQYNIYTETGFDVYSAGCAEPNVRCPLPPTPPAPKAPISYVESVLLGVAVVTGAVLIALLVLTVRRRQRHGEQPLLSSAGYT